MNPPEITRHDYAGHGVGKSFCHRANAERDAEQPLTDEQYADTRQQGENGRDEDDHRASRSTPPASI
jgi:hypothetical protein